MDGSDDEEAPRVSLPETPPVKTKTLFHYFKATPGSKPKKEESQVWCFNHFNDSSVSSRGGWVVKAATS